jgi:hypothetical protein
MSTLPVIKGGASVSQNRFRTELFTPRTGSLLGQVVQSGSLLDVLDRSMRTRHREEVKIFTLYPMELHQDLIADKTPRGLLRLDRILVSVLESRQ